MNISEHKYYVYSQGGLLLNRVDYTLKHTQYGTPTAVSNNGQIFIFRQQKSLTIDILVMTKDTLVHIKKVNLKKEIDKYVEMLAATDSGKASALRAQLDSNEYAPYMHKDKSKLKFQINDNMDIAVCFY